MDGNDIVKVILNFRKAIMFPAVEIFLFCFLSYLAITRIVPQFIRWIIKRCYHIEARIGRIGIPYLTLHDVQLCTNGFTIEIDQIGFRSSFLSSEVSKLVNVVIHDMRINKDMVSQSKHSNWRPPESFDDVRIPPLVITIAQFVSVRILNVTLAVVSQSLVLHSTLTEVSTDASVVHSTRCLLVSLNLASSTARLLSVSGRVHVSAACVGVDASLVASTPLAVQNVSVSFKNIKTVIDDDFFPNIERKQKKVNEHVTEKRTDFKQIINKTSPIIPKELSVSFDNCIITDATDRDMTTLQKFIVNTSFKPSIKQYCGIQGSVGINLVLEGLDMRSATDTQLVLKLLEYNMNLGDRGLLTKLIVREFTTLYDHDKMNWISQFLPNSGEAEKSEEKNNWWPDIPIEAKIEFWNVSTALRMPNLSPAVIGFSHLKFKYDSNLNGPSNSGNLWELESESIWCQLAKFGGPGNLRKEHTWGTALAASFVLVKGGPLRSSALLETVRLEWSPPLADILLPLVSMLSSRIKNSNPKALKNPSKPKSINISMASTNVFFIANKKVCLMMRVDKAGIESSLPLKVCVEAEGIKISSISPTSTTFLCARSSDIKGWSGNIELIRGEWNKNLNQLNLKIFRQIQLQWNPNLHLKTMEMCHHVIDFLRTVKNEEDKPTSDRSVSSKPLGLSVVITGHFKIVLKVSKQHYFAFATDDFIFNKSGNECCWSTSSIKVAVDNADIFSFDGLSFAVLHENDPAKESVELIKTERANNEDFVLPWNRAWLIKMKSVKAIFPYDHNFSAAFQDEFITVIKWLKRLHKRRSSDANLPPDLLIKIKDFIFEMSDDPFEVRLRDNYELLEDEYNENLKREKMLDEKINQMMETNVLMPAEKVEDLYNTLSVVSTRIYIKRSKLMQEQGTRTRLFAWLVSDLQLLALADPTIHGPANVVENMTQIDTESPWPTEGLEFSTLWCRAVVINCKELKFQLRDFPQPWLDLRQLQMWGKVVGAEQIPTRRAKRSVELDLGEGWGKIEIERSMTSLKLYHDLNCEIEHFSYAFGPCWEPVIAQCNLSFEKIVRASLDPSPPLPLWDKLRLLLHGRVTLVVRQLTVLLHASLDPYNKTEEMEITWSSVAIDWTNAKVVFKGNLDIYVRTASKYDDCRLLHLPNVRLSIKLGWACLGDPNDHHSVMPCAPDKLPDYSSNQEHDSFRPFRSQNLNVRLALETKPVASSTGNDFNCPVALLYGSTLRWFENLKLILSGVTRPTRRGSVFQNMRPKKLPLSRHYKKVHLLLSLHTFQVHYWMSFAMQRGFELTGESIAFSSEHQLGLIPINDGLKHRPRAEWSVVYMTCELHAAEIWLRSAIQNNEQTKEKLSLRQPVEKCYFLSVGKVSYGREGAGLDSAANPTHRLVVYGLKGAWTTSNRDVVAALYDTFIKTKQLKKNLSTEALKGFRRETNSSALKPQAIAADSQTTNLSTPNTNNLQQQATPSPLSKLQCGHAATMLQQLIAEADSKAVVFSDEPATETNEQQLQGLAACQHADDVIHKNWLIALVNSQVLLKGPETEGYVIISATKAEILQRLHRPVWRDRTLVAKTTWVGSLQSMQYYATVSAGQASLDENIMWLNVDNIKEKDDCVIAELPDVPQLVGSGQSVGGVVSETVGASSAGNDPPLQLQRIVSRCKCEFFYVCYGENSMSPSNFSNVPTPPPEDPSTPWENQSPPVDAFTLMHHDLDVCTNSLQYAMLLDIINNLLLYVEPSRREAYERVQRMRFQLQLQSVEDQRKPIQEAQTRVRSLLSKLKGIEKEMYLVQRALGDEPNSCHLLQQIESLERQVFACKESLTVQSEELNAMISCYKETQLMGQKSASQARSGDTSISVVRASEICFKHAQWRLTDADGQLGIADLVLSNFLYTKNSKSDDSVEHLLELGYVRMTNLLPNQIYKEVLQPTEIHNNMPVDRKRALRVFCREKAPVGGISVKEHFEINLVPLTIGLTKKFFNKMLKFCFPERDTEENELPDDSGSVDGNRRVKLHHKGKEASFYVPIERKDDVEKMKERAEKNKLFIYIKIPEVPVRVSYKGNKEKNFEDIRDFSLVIPTLEYHNVTWTWLDLLLAMKSDSRRVILSQAIKQKLQINKFRTGTEEGASPQEEDKARMLFGNRLLPGETKPSKKGIFKFPK